MLTNDIYKKPRIAYIIEAALEYFIALLITDSFLATLLTRSGVSDAATGVVTQLASLAFTAQVFSVFVRKNRGLKWWVTILHFANQMMFVLLYLIPVIDVPSNVKLILFVVLFLGGQFIANIISPYKLAWLMSVVPDKSRGRFTANKEIISSIGGMIFSFVMGTLVDYYKGIGQENMGFTLCGITIFVLAILHTVSLLVMKEPEENAAEEHRPAFFAAAYKTVTNKNLLKLIGVDVLWHLSIGISISFYGVYQINELGFSLQYVSILAILSSISRVAFSRSFGKLADRSSWAHMMTVCFAIATGAFFINIFTVPSNGKVLFAIYACIYAISIAGINSGLMNIAFDYVSREDRAAALGIKYAIGGFASFIAALIGSSIVSHIQAAGNKLLFINVYAQQVLSAIAFVICLILVLYMKRVICKLNTNDDK